jgi:hypothetical protein
MIDDCAIIQICLFDKVVCSREFFVDSRARLKKIKVGVTSGDTGRINLACCYARYEMKLLVGMK